MTVCHLASGVACCRGVDTCGGPDESCDMKKGNQCKWLPRFQQSSEIGVTTWPASCS